MKYVILPAPRMEIAACQNHPLIVRYYARFSRKWPIYIIMDSYTKNGNSIQTFGKGSFVRTFLLIQELDFGHAICFI